MGKYLPLARFGNHLAGSLQAFEQAQFHQLLNAAERRGFPLRILKLALQAQHYTGACDVGGATSDAVCTSQAILPRRARATVLLKCLVLTLFDNVMARNKGFACMRGVEVFRLQCIPALWK